MIKANQMATLLALAAMLNAWPSSAVAQSANGNRDLMVSRPCKQSQGCTHSWSLTSRLGQILEDYEKRIGPRNRAYRILGIEFTSGGRPRIWYPDFGNGTQSIIVQLTRRARYERSLALFQLGHEAFHLMEPMPGIKASFWEEGLASHFAIAYLEKNGFRNGLTFLTEKNYRRAYDLVEQVAELYGEDFDSRLKRLRKRQPSFSKVSIDDLREAFPKIPAQVARKLASPFPLAVVSGSQR